MRSTHPDNRPAQISFWLGVCATLVSLREPQFGTFLFGVPLGLGAVVLGIFGLVRARRDGGRSLALTGLVLGLVGPFAALAGWVLVIELFDIPCC
jgi:hypothetical protein